MSSVPARSSRLESSISTFLLVLLFIIGTGVFLKQFDTDMSRFGVEADTIELSSQRLETNTEKEIALESLIPLGFEPLSEVEVYIVDNLYEKINGKAPLYINAGFVKLFTQRFASKDDENIRMEVYLYDMGGTKNAFSVYSMQKRADAQDLEDLGYAYKTGNAVYLSHNKYYAELLGWSESEQILEAIRNAAENIKSRLASGEDTQIAELNLFPTENIVPGSHKLYLANAFGFEGLTDIFTCRYKLGDENITAFLSKRPDPQNAQEAANSYYNFLIQNDAKNKSTANETLKPLNVRLLDFYGTTEIIFTVGPFVAGIHEAENQQRAEELAITLSEELSQKVKDTKKTQMQQ
jgi:hypothetical protein